MLRKVDSFPHSHPSQERDEQIVALTAAMEKRGVALAEPAPLPLFPPVALGEVSEGLAPRRSKRLASTTTGELSRVRAELDQCRAELLEKTQGKRRGRTRTIGNEGSLDD